MNNIQEFPYSNSKFLIKQKLIIQWKTDLRSDYEIQTDQSLIQSLISTIKSIQKSESYKSHQHQKDQLNTLINLICGNKNQSLDLAIQIIQSIRQKPLNNYLKSENNIIDFILLNKQRINSELFYFNDLNKLVFGIQDQFTSVNQIISVFNENMKNFQQKYNFEFKNALQRSLNYIKMNFTESTIQQPIFKDMQYSDYLLTRDYDEIQFTILRHFGVKATFLLNWLQFLKKLVSYVQIMVGNTQCLASNVFKINNSDFHSITTKFYFTLSGAKIKFFTTNQLIAEVTNQINMYSRKSLCGIQQILQFLFFSPLQIKNQKIEVKQNNFLMIRDEENKLIDSAINIQLLGVYDIFDIQNIEQETPYQSLNVLYYVTEKIDEKLKTEGFINGCILDRLLQFEDQMMKELELKLLGKSQIQEQENSHQIAQKIIQRIKQFNTQFTSLNVQPIGYLLDQYLDQFEDIKLKYQQRTFQQVNNTKFTKFLNQQFNQQNLTVTEIIKLCYQLQIKYQDQGETKQLQNGLIYELKRNDLQISLKYLQDFYKFLTSEDIKIQNLQQFQNLQQKLTTTLQFNFQSDLFELLCELKQVQDMKIPIVLNNEICNELNKFFQNIGIKKLRNQNKVLNFIQSLYGIQDFLKSRFQFFDQHQESKQNQNQEQGLINLLNRTQFTFQRYQYILSLHQISVLKLQILLFDNTQQNYKFDDYRKVLDDFNVQCYYQFTIQNIFQLIDENKYVDQKLLVLQKFTKVQIKTLYQQLCFLFIDNRIKYGSKIQKIIDIWELLKQKHNNDIKELNKKIENESESITQTDQSNISIQTSTSNIQQISRSK